MTWTNYLIWAVALTTFCGSILFGIWYLIGKILEATGFINIMYELMKAILLFWLLPLIFPFVYRTNFAGWGGVIFRNSTFAENAAKVIVAGWILGASVLLLDYLIKNWRLSRKLQTVFPEEGEVLDYFYEICEELGIQPGKVDLVRDERESVPCIFGIRQQCVVLPMREYSMEELRVILIHELTHYKQKNHWLRHGSAIAAAIHFFNPFMWIFLRKIREWGEYACDYEAISKVGSMKQYFLTILDVMVATNSEDTLSSGLFRKESELESRIKKMQRSYTMKKKSKVLATLIVTGMVMLSGTSVYAATNAACQNYWDFYSANVEDTQETIEGVTTDGEDYVEYTADGFEDGYEIVVGDVSMARTTKTFSWTIKPGLIWTVPDFSKKSGETISVTASIDPTSAAARVGIIQPDGTLRYVNARNGVAAYTFTLTQTGKYSVYVQNKSTVTINTGGSYRY